MITGHPPALTPGLRHRASMAVEARHTVPGIDPSWPGFADMPPVLATATMIGFIEQTCICGLRPLLSAGQHTVGVHVDVSHLVATPVGMTITAEVALTGVEGRTLHFRVSCHDEAGLIGEGTHQRAVIDVARFMQRLQQKAGAIAATADQPPAT